jgi:hypothetical protein
VAVRVAAVDLVQRDGDERGHPYGQGGEQRAVAGQSNQRDDRAAGQGDREAEWRRPGAISSRT